MFGIAVHIHDLNIAFSEGPDRVEMHGVPMINFVKWTNFHDRLKDVLKHKPPDVSRYRQTKAEVLAYLKDQLRRTPSSRVVAEYSKKRRGVLEQQEELMCTQAGPALRILGMK